MDLFEKNLEQSQTQHHFSEQEQYGLYKSIFNRRDVRGQFLATKIPYEVLSRILYAAHHAPSVGFMQPWNFIVIQSPEIKSKIHQSFTLAHQEAQAMFEKDKQVNSSSLIGYYANVKLINDSKGKIELFSLGSEVSESSK